jgi:hypothetical protein
MYIVMSQSYQKPCRDCKQEITMMELNGKWGAYNLDGGFHQCKKNGQGPVVMVNQGPVGEPLTLESLDVRLKRVEAMFVGGGPQK